jgi:hypothetical protein
MPMMRNVFTGSLLLALCAVCASAAQPTDKADPRPAWPRVTIGRANYYCMPEDVARSLGCDRKSISDDRNAAALYLRAIREWTPPRDLPPDSYDLALKSPWDPARLPEVATWMKTNAECLTTVGAASLMADCQFSILMDRSGNTVLASQVHPQLTYMRQFAQAIIIEGHRLEAAGQTREALVQYARVLRLGRHAAQQPSLVGGFMGIALDSLGLGAIQELALRREVSADVLAWLVDATSAVLRDLPDPTLAMQGEKVLALNSAKNTLHPPSSVASSKAATPASSATDAFVHGRVWQTLVPERLITEDVTQGFEEIIASAGLDFWEVPAGADEAVAQVRCWDFVARDLMPGLRQIAVKYAENRAQVSGVVLVAALRLYRVRNGAYPERLTDLLGPCLQALPTDPFSGRPFRYVKTGEHFLLYSVGPDLTDDGGSPEKSGLTRYDIIFTDRTGEGH